MNATQGLIKQDVGLLSKKGIAAVLLSALIGALGVSSFDIVDEITGSGQIYSDEKKILAPQILSQLNEYQLSWKNLVEFKISLSEMEKITISDRNRYFILIHQRNLSFQALSVNLNQGNLFFGEKYQKLVRKFLAWDIGKSYQLKKPNGLKSIRLMDKKWLRFSEDFIAIIRKEL